MFTLFAFAFESFYTSFKPSDENNPLNSARNNIQLFFEDKELSTLTLHLFIKLITQMYLKELQFMIYFE